MAINDNINNNAYSHRWQNPDYLRGSLPKARKAPHCPHCNPTCPHGYPAYPTGPIWVVPMHPYDGWYSGNISVSTDSTTFNH